MEIFKPSTPMANQSKVAAAGSNKHTAPSTSANAARKKKKTTSRQPQAVEPTHAEKSNSDDGSSVDGQADAAPVEVEEDAEEDAEDELSKPPSII
jgi:hypothetical protein